MAVSIQSVSRGRARRPWPLRGTVRGPPASAFLIAAGRRCAPGRSQAAPGDAPAKLLELEHLRRGLLGRGHRLGSNGNGYGRDGSTHGPVLGDLPSLHVERLDRAGRGRRPRSPCRRPGSRRPASRSRPLRPRHAGGRSRPRIGRPPRRARTHHSATVHARHEGSISTWSLASRVVTLATAAGRGGGALGDVHRGLGRARQEQAGNGALDGRSFRCTSSRKPSLPTGAFVMSIRPDTSPGITAHAEDHQVDRHFQVRAEGQRVADLHPQWVRVRGVRELHVGRRLVVEAKEQDARLGGVRVVRLLVLLVGPDVAVQVHHRCLRIPGADLVGSLERGRAAHSRAVLVERAAGSGLVHALDLAAAQRSG